MTITISEPTKELAEARLAEILRLYGGVPLDRILFKSGRYVIEVEVKTISK